MARRAMVLAALIVAFSPLAAQSLAPTLPATEYIHAGGKTIVTLKNSDHIFGDMTPSDEAFGPAHIVLDRRITQGCGVAIFCPSDLVTRGQTAVFVIRSLFSSLGANNYPYDPATNPTGFPYPTTPYFTDVPTSHIFFPYIQKIKELGITLGCSYDLYCPDDSVTNGQIAVFTVRAWELRTTSTVPGQPGPYPPSGNFTYTPTPYFPDDATPYSPPPVDSWFKYIQKARDLNIITTGCTPTAFCPNTPITRGKTTFYHVRGILGDFMY
ncbi:MAG: hypothetical protein ACRD8O_07220 [Bryobacteraceae bacterium]